MGISIMINLLNAFSAHCPMCIGKYSCKRDKGVYSLPHHYDVLHIIVGYCYAIHKENIAYLSLKLEIHRLKEDVK